MLAAGAFSFAARALSGIRWCGCLGLGTIIDDPKIRHPDTQPPRLTAVTIEPLPPVRFRIAPPLAPLPDKFTLEQGIVENADERLGVAADRRGIQLAAARFRNPFVVEALGDLDRGLARSAFASRWVTPPSQPISAGGARRVVSHLGGRRRHLVARGSRPTARRRPAPRPPMDASYTCRSWLPHRLLTCG